MTKPAIHRTTYDRSACDIGMVHIGYGAFHRAHQAVYIDDYMHRTGDLGWGIAAVNLRASESAAFAQAASAQDGYLLKAISPDGSLSYRAVRSHLAFVDVASDLEAAVSLLSRPTVKAASMTVTESGYAFKDDWSLDLEAPPIKAELDGGPVQTLYGFLARALDQRRVTLDQPITLLCCDNIRNNGKVVRGALLSYLRAQGNAGLVDWVKANVTFPCSMVDRITPRATPDLVEEVAQAFPDYAVAPIHAEAFSQWVLENNFASDMPNLALAGVEVVDNVEPYEEAKIRILNGGHTGLAYLGALGGHQTFDQAIRDPQIRDHFDRFETQEVLRGLGDAVPFDTQNYLGKVTARFENAGIADQLERICMDGYSKMAIYIRPTLRACLAQGHFPQASYDCVASWVVYARKIKAGTMPIAYFEPFWDALLPMLEPGQEAALASDPKIWGDLPLQHDSFVPDMVAAINRMDQKWQA